MPVAGDDHGGAGSAPEGHDNYGDFGNGPWDNPLYDADFFLRLERYELNERERAERATSIGGEFGQNDDEGMLDANLRLQQNGVELLTPASQRTLVNDLLEDYKSGPDVLHPHRTNLGERASNWTDKDTLSKIGAAAGAAGDMIGGGFDFVKNYAKMVWVNTKGADKFYHCMANCEATERGVGGEYIATLISNTRELSDLSRADSKGISSEQATKDIVEDLFVNRVGRQGANNGLRCNDACNWFKPKGL